MRLISMLMFFLLTAHTAITAQRTVNGNVTTESGDEMIGVNIVEVGTTNGTISDIDGSFTINVNEGATLSFSFTGYQTQEIAVGNQSTLNVVLIEGSLLDEVVVTGLGIKRETKALGYGVTEVKGEELTEARENNVINQLTGKVAGVNITNSATGPAGSSRVIIRGNSSLGGDNQPLYVVDGIPIDNTNLGSAGMWGGLDLGDGLSSINPDDIENISVLKGPASTAIYGSRGQNGVILITTKTGSGGNGNGIGVEFNSNYVTEEPLDLYSDIQTEFGYGSQGMKPDDVMEAISNTRSSWGARLDGSQVIQFDGSMAPYSVRQPIADAVYGNGNTFTNTIALSGGDANTNFRLSFSDLKNNGLFENTGYDRNTVTARGSSGLGDGKVQIDAKVTYSNERANNRPALSDSPHNPGHLNQLGHGVNIDLLRNVDEITGEYDPLYSGSIFRVNPYFGVYQQFNGDTRDRIQGFASATWNILDNLSLMVRGGTDYYTFRQTTWDGEQTPHLNRAGRMSENERRVRENNYDFLLSYSPNISDDFSVSVNFGGNQRQRTFELLQNSGDEFIVYGLRTLSNTAFPGRNYDYSEKRVNSVYGSAQLGYKNFLYLDLTGRNDWSSTLPAENRSYFYPSVSLSFILSDAFDIGWQGLSFAKARLSYAQVGGDTDPYSLNLTYSVVGEPHLGNPQAQISQNRIPLATLKPTLTNAIEAGLDLRFFNNRLGLDIAYYSQSTTDQILATTISATSGFGDVTVNAGEITNKGIEFLLSGTPIQNPNGFSWETSFNYARNRNEVVALDDDGKLSALRLETSRQRNVFVEAQVGQPYAAIVGRRQATDDQGRLVYSADGIPQAGDLEVIGSGVPDWTGGFSNTFRFKNFDLNALIDFRFGGELHSMTNLTMTSAGLHSQTLDGRDEWYASEAAREAAGVEPADWDPTGGYRIQGVDTEGNPIDMFLNPQVYWGNYASNIGSAFIYSADFIKLRQMTLGYTFPNDLFSNLPIQGARISLVARNLFFLHKDIPNVDPESVYNSGNGQGLEYATIPNARSYGVNLNLRF